MPHRRSAPLPRHLDSVGPDTPIRDIGDSCRVWESHAEDTDSWGGCHELEYPRVIYQVVEDSKPKVASEKSDVLEQIMRHLLPTPAVLPPKATPIPSDRELLIQRLLGTVHPVHPVVQERSNSSTEYASGRIGGRGICAAAGASSGADGLGVFRVASWAMRLRGALFWMSRFLSCHRDGGLNRTDDEFVL